MKYLKIIFILLIATQLSGCLFTRIISAPMRAVGGILHLGGGGDKVTGNFLFLCYRVAAPDRRRSGSETRQHNFIWRLL